MTKTKTMREIAKLSSLVWKCRGSDSPVLDDYSNYLLDRICYLKLSINLKPTDAEWMGRTRHNANVDALYARAKKREICEAQLFPGEKLTVY